MYSIDERVTFLREAGMVDRCHVWPTIRTMTVAAHSYNALNLYLLLCPEPQVNTIMEIMWHDSGERGVGDIPSTAKWNSPDLHHHYEELEKKIRKKFGLESGISRSQVKWVVGVDKLEFFLYCQEEFMMGNRYALSRLSNIEESLDRNLAEKDLPSPVLEFYVRNCSRDRLMLCDKEIPS